MYVSPHCVAFLVSIGTLLAQGPPALVRDIQTNLPPSYDYGRIVAGVLSGPLTYFLADDGGTKIRLWRTDGTTGTTTIVKEIDGSYGDVARPEMVARNGIVFFTAPSFAEGDELWRTDGTPNGTFVLEINLGSDGASPRNLVVNTASTTTAVYFSATKPSTGRELCCSDGTVAGTLTVADVYPGATSSMSLGDPIAMGQYLVGTVALSAMYFAATDPALGKELFRFRTSAVLHADINAGPNSSVPRSLTSSNGYLMFTATGPQGLEPYFVSDTGTVSVVDVRPGAQGSSPTNVVANPQRTGATFCFSANDGVNGSELWRRTSGGVLSRTDFALGTASSSPVMTPLAAGSALVIAGPSTSRRLYHLTLASNQITQLSTGNSVPEVVYSGMLFNPARALVTAQPSQPFTDSSLFVTDGTPAGTIGYPSLFPTPVGTPLSALPGMDRALMSSGQVTDGLPANITHLIPGIGVTGDASPSSFAETTPGTIIFTAADQMNTDRRLYRSDGTTAGTYLLADVQPLSSLAFNVWQGPFSALYQGRRFFAGRAAGQTELWATDGTIAGTTMVADLVPGSGSSYPGPYAVCGSTLIFFTFTNSRTLWRSDGTAAGTTVVRSFPAAATLPQPPTSCLVVNGMAYFVSNETASGLELWRSDGTVAGTFLVKDINPGSVGGMSSLAQLTPLVSDPSQFVFVADDGVHGAELWKSGGTNATTQLVKDINPGAAHADFRLLGNNGARLFFAANDGVHGEEPWSTDGTAANTVSIADVNPGSASSSPSATGALASTFLFNASTATSRQLWRSVGTPATTGLVRDFSGNVAVDLWGTGAAIAGKMVFTAYEGPVLGFRPWVTDGTAGGTALLSALASDTETGASFFTIPGAGKALFKGADGLNGTELWVTDGTPSGTMMHAQIRPFFPSSHPGGFFAAGNQIYFTATDGQHGRELYAMTAMAGVMAYGEGCPGAGGNVPSIAGATVPQLGASFNLRLDNARASSPVALYVGFAPDELPIGGGCALLWSLAAPSISLAGFSNARGEATLSVPVPDDANLEGLQIYCQYVVIDPAGAFSNLAAFSNGARAILGRP